MHFTRWAHCQRQLASFSIYTAPRSFRSEYTSNLLSEANRKHLERHRVSDNKLEVYSDLNGLLLIHHQSHRVLPSAMPSALMKSPVLSSFGPKSRIVRLHMPSALMKSPVLSTWWALGGHSASTWRALGGYTRHIINE